MKAYDWWPYRLAQRVEPGEAVTIEAAVVDKQCVELNDATVVAQVTRPGGTTMTCRCSGPASATASIAARSSAREAGRLREWPWTRRAPADSRSAAARPTCAPAPSEAEYFDPTMHEAPLRRIAEETGGRFYTPDTVDGTCRRRALRGPRRDVGRGARALEHADHPDHADGSRLRRVGLPPRGGAWP